MMPTKTPRSCEYRNETQNNGCIFRSRKDSYNRSCNTFVKFICVWRIVCENGHSELMVGDLNFASTEKIEEMELKEPLGKNGANETSNEFEMKRARLCTSTRK